MTPITDPKPRISSPHWTDGIGEQASCQNCGAPRDGEFCRNCGQRQIQSRATFYEWGKETFARLTNWDSGIFFTIQSMLRRPGLVVRDYVIGKQKPYLNPLTYLFLGAAAQLLSLWLLEGMLREILLESFAQNELPMSGELVERMEEKLGTDFHTALCDTYLNSLQQGYSYAALFFFAIPFSVALYVTHRLTREPFTLGETTVFAFYTTGHMLLVTSITSPILFQIHTSVQAFSGPLIYLLITVQSHRHFFANRFSSWAATLVSILAAMMVFLPSILLIFIISFAVRLWSS